MSLWLRVVSGARFSLLFASGWACGRKQKEYRRASRSCANSTVSCRQGGRSRLCGHVRPLHGEAKAFASGRNVKLVDGPLLDGLIKSATATRGTRIKAVVTPAKDTATPSCSVCTKPMLQRTAKRGSVTSCFSAVLCTSYRL
jgi:hypothetical protein